MHALLFQSPLKSLFPQLLWCIYHYTGYKGDKYSLWASQLDISVGFVARAEHPQCRCQ